MNASAHRSRAARGARCLTIMTAMLLGFAGTVQAARDCPETPALPAMHLPHLRAALAVGDQGLIVTLGSSSTEGAMATDTAHTYPAVLQRMLSDIWPASHVAVINRGIGGQDAPEELARLQADVIAIRPQMVIWQVGANGTLRDANPEVFRGQVTAGVAAMRAAGIDVVLMDNQRSPRITAAPDHAVLDAELAQVAGESGVNLFSRGKLMDAWQRMGAAPLRFVASDGLHHNDLGYHCVAAALAQAIGAAVRAPVSMAARH
jgi:lysophospholipase L1-like esterase